MKELINNVFLGPFKDKLRQKGEVYLRIKASPGMAKTEIKDILEDETMKINVAAQREKGRANQALVLFLADEFSVSKDSVKIISGAADKLKLIKIIK